jgi:biopolymer transport protein ExbB
MMPSLLGYSLYQGLSDSMYLVLALQGLWGLYCVVLVWNRVNQKRFKSEEAQDAFLDDVEEMLNAGDFQGTLEYCEGDNRGLAQMVTLAVENRALGFKRARQVMLDRFQRDVMSDIEYTLSWVSAMIKTGPMVGLFGTVFGMMGAFSKVSSSESTVDPKLMAGDIQVALITTACGLAIAIPLMLLSANINIKISKMQDLLGTGLQRFYEAFKVGLSRAEGAGGASMSAANRAEPAAAYRQP